MSYDAWYNEQCKKQRKDADLSEADLYVETELQNIAKDDERIACEEAQLD